MRKKKRQQMSQTPGGGAKLNPSGGGTPLAPAGETPGSSSLAASAEELSGEVLSDEDGVDELSAEESGLDPDELAGVPLEAASSGIPVSAEELEAAAEPEVSEEMEALLAELSAAATAEEEAADARQTAHEEAQATHGGEDGVEGIDGLLSELLGGEEPGEAVEAAGLEDLEAIPEPGAFQSLEGGFEPSDSEVGEPELFLAGEDFDDAALIEAAAAREAEPEGIVLPERNLGDVVAAIDGAIASAPNMISHAFGGPAQQVHQKQPLEDYVVFSMADMDYALPIEDVLEIGSLPLITRVPSLPEFVRGIMNHRGEVITVLSLPTLFGYAEPASARARILLVRPKNRSYTAALLVEDVKGIQRIPSQQLHRAPRTGASRMTAVLRGLHGGAERTLGVMDLGKLFVLPEVRQLEPQ